MYAVAAALQKRPRFCGRGGLRLFQQDGARLELWFVDPSLLGNILIMVAVTGRPFANVLRILGPPDPSERGLVGQQRIVHDDAQFPFPTEMCVAYQLSSEARFVSPVLVEEIVAWLRQAP